GRPLDQGGAIPAVALTAYARVEDRVNILTAGFQMHVVKPVEPAELVAVVASLARPARNAREASGSERGPAEAIELVRVVPPSRRNASGRSRGAGQWDRRWL